MIINQLDQYSFCPRCRNKLSLKKIDDQPRKVCANCDFIFWNNPNPSATVLLYRDGKVLLLRRKHEPFKGYWVLPGGYLESSEDPDATAIREAKEETGFKEIKLEHIVGAYRTPEEPRGVDIDIIYSAKATTDPVLSDEHDQWRYFNPNDLPELIAYRHRQAIQDWYSLSSRT